MPCRMFRRMEDKAEDGGWQRRASNCSHLEQGLLGRDTKLLDRAIDELIHLCRHCRECGGRTAGCALLPQVRALRLRQRFTTRIRQQAIERASQMPHVESDRCGPTGPDPYMFLGHVSDEALEILARLKERVDCWHQQRLESWNGPALPHFGLLSRSHAETVPDLCGSFSLKLS